jgi:hypothetical protein
MSDVDLGLAVGVVGGGVHDVSAARSWADIFQSMSDIHHTMSRQREMFGVVDLGTSRRFVDENAVYYNAGCSRRQRAEVVR